MFGVRLSELPFDVQVFAKFPKCTGRWGAAEGMGCLWTAFLAGFGFKLTGGLTPQQTFDTYHFEGHGLRFLPASSLMVQMVNELIDDIGGITYDGSGDFMDHTIHCFDHRREREAVQLMWDVICRLPNKVGNTTTVVQMPPHCDPVEVSCQ